MFINFYDWEKGSQYSLMFGEEGIGSFTKVNGEHTEKFIRDIHIPPNEWFNISINLTGNYLSININGDELIGTSELDPGLKEDIFLHFVTQNEIWIDNMVLTRN